jgi:two-component system, NtrC family, response regulator PilR
MSVPRVLVVDDEADLRELFEITLLKMGLDVDTADCLTAARGFLVQHEYSLVLTDMRLPDGLGLELVAEVNSKYKNTPIAVVTAYGSTDNAVVALKAGAFDYVSKPVALDQLRLMVHSALGVHRGKVQGSAEATGPGSSLIGQSCVMNELRTQITRLARSMAPIAITGESGSGKEVVAREIHTQSARVGKPFVAVNCGAIPEALMEAEFFGYRKGAFTGATDERDGFFQAANGGTLLLDEVADLPLAMQVKLLRAIQERRVRKLGATNEEPVDVRIISATHQNLADWVEKGKFRQDLFYRLNVIEIRVPALRERLDDLTLLAEGILRRLGGGQKMLLSPDAQAVLAGYAFPGNVRELENILERALAFANDGMIEVADLALKGVKLVPGVLDHADNAVAAVAAVAEVTVVTEVKASAMPIPPLATEAIAMGDEPPLPSCLPEYLNNVERNIIQRALAQTQFNRTQAAELLGISFRQLRYQMQRLNIHAPE